MQKISVVLLFLCLWNNSVALASEGSCTNAYLLEVSEKISENLATYEQEAESWQVYTDMSDNERQLVNMLSACAIIDVQWQVLENKFFSFCSSSQPQCRKLIQSTHLYAAMVAASKTVKLNKLLPYQMRLRQEVTAQLKHELAKAITIPSWSEEVGVYDQLYLLEKQLLNISARYHNYGWDRLQAAYSSLIVDLKNGGGRLGQIPGDLRWDDSALGLPLLIPYQAR